MSERRDGMAGGAGFARRARGLLAVMAMAAGVMAMAGWLGGYVHVGEAGGAGLGGVGFASAAHASGLMQPPGIAGRPIYTSRELADGEIAVLDAETVLAHWNAEIELCSRMVDQLASLANEDVSGKARLSPYPGMLSKALNARQDATLALARAKGRFEAMKRINTEAMTMAPVSAPASAR